MIYFHDHDFLPNALQMTAPQLLMLSISLILGLVAILISENIQLRDWRKDFTPSQTEEVPMVTFALLKFSATSRLIGWLKNDVDLIESLLLLVSGMVDPSPRYHNQYSCDFITRETKERTYATAIPP